MSFRSRVSRCHYASVAEDKRFMVEHEGLSRAFSGSTEPKAVSLVRRMMEATEWGKGMHAAKAAERDQL